MKESELAKAISSIVEEHANQIFKIRRVAFFVRHTIYSNLVNKMAIPLLYSYWEGLVESVIKLYLDFINQQRFTPTAVAETLLAYRLRPYFFRAQDRHVCESPSKASDLAGEITKIASSHVFFDLDSIKVSGNLNYKNLRRLCEWFCIDLSQSRITETRLNDFVQLRHDIAHGGPTDEIPYEAVIEWCDFVVQLMEEFGEAVAACVRNKAYLRSQ